MVLKKKILSPCIPSSPVWSRYIFFKATHLRALTVTKSASYSVYTAFALDLIGLILHFSYIPSPTSVPQTSETRIEEGKKNKTPQSCMRHYFVSLSIPCRDLYRYVCSNVTENVLTISATATRRNTRRMGEFTIFPKSMAVEIIRRGHEVDIWPSCTVLFRDFGGSGDGRSKPNEETDNRLRRLWLK